MTIHKRIRLHVLRTWNVINFPTTDLRFNTVNMKSRNFLSKVIFSWFIVSTIFLAFLYWTLKNLKYLWVSLYELDSKYIEIWISKMVGIKPQKVYLRIISWNWSSSIFYLRQSCVLSSFNTSDSCDLFQWNGRIICEEWIGKDMERIGVT